MPATPSSSTRLPLLPLPTNRLPPVPGDFFYSSSSKKSTSDALPRPSKRRRVEVETEEKVAVKQEDQEMMSLLSGLDDDTSLFSVLSPTKSPSRVKREFEQVTGTVLGPMTGRKEDVEALVAGLEEDFGVEIWTPPSPKPLPKSPNAKPPGPPPDEMDIPADFSFDISPSPSPQKPHRPKGKERILYPVLNPPIHVQGEERYEPVPWFRGEVMAVLRGVRAEGDAVSRWGWGEKVVLVKDVSAGGEYKLILRDDFARLRIATGDIVNVISPLIPKGTAGPLSQTAKDMSPLKPSLDLPSRLQITLSHSHPTTHLILHPDHLLPPTSLSSPNCSRRPLLSQLLRAPSPPSKPLLYGNIIHEVLQLALQRREWGEHALKGLLGEVMGGKAVELECWAADVGGEEGREEVRGKMEGGVFGFGGKWVGGMPKPNATLHQSSTNLAISGLHEVEESIWSPKWGMKGKIDASVQAVLSGEELGTGDNGQPMPFEIKTGRAVGVMEHRAQTMLYTLLMEDRYQTPIQAGLLYYTQTDSLLRVPAAKAEIRGLLMARNEQATYLSRSRSSAVAAGDVRRPSQKGSQKVRLGGEESMGIVEELMGGLEEKKTAVYGKKGYEVVEVEEIGILPPTVDDPRGCKTCYSVNECMLYRRAVDWVEPDPDDPIADLYETKTGHLTDEDAAFFYKWEQLVSVEEQDMIRFKNQLWTMTAKEREKTGRCFADMVILEHRDEQGASLAKIHQHTYRFGRSPDVTPAKGTFLNGHIGKGDPISLSIEPDLVSIARGFVVDLTPTEVVIGSNAAIDVDALMERTGRHPEHDLGPVFRIDKDEMMAGTSRMRNNLAQLFYTKDNGGDEKRRRLIVGLDEPTFEAIWAPDEEEIPEHLNVDQRAAMAKVLTAKDYALILGMPGTGKTTTIAEIIIALVKRGKSVLLTSYTHSAVDTILMKLVNSDYKMLRLGNVDKVHPDVAHLTLDSLPPASSLSELEARLMSPQIVATTCLSIDHPLFKRRTFDYCIVDEASQITLPTCLGPLRFADTFVLVGDHFQLPPIVRNPEARRGGLDVSLFFLLSETHKSAVVDLAHQYRMNEDIMSLSNKLIYGGRLKCGTEGVAKQALELPRSWREVGQDVCEEGNCWIEKLLDPSVKAVFVDTDRVPARESRVGDLVQNAVEGQLIHQLVAALIECGIKPANIAVITPYRQQIKLLTGLLKGQKGVEILTADKSQGRDKDCIIVSMVRSNDLGNIGDLLRDWRRINVSFTRAKKKLIILGSRSTLSTDCLLSEFFELMQERGWIQQLKPGAVKVHEGMWPGSQVKEEAKKEPREGKGKLGEGLLASRPFLRDALNDITNANI